MLAVPGNILFFHGCTDRCLFLCAYWPDDLVALIQGQMCIAPHCTLIAGERNCDGLDSKDEMQRSDHNIVFDQFCTKFLDFDLGVNKKIAHANNHSLYSWHLCEEQAPVSS